MRDLFLASIFIACCTPAAIAQQRPLLTEDVDVIKPVSFASNLDSSFFRTSDLPSPACAAI